MAWPKGFISNYYLWTFWPELQKQNKKTKSGENYF